MTDKEQIMIDGVNVGGCKYLPYCNDKQGNCAFEPNCYFKQLFRKTQECEQKDERIIELTRAYEELKEKFEALKLENQEGYEIVAGLKHECEELKKELNGSEKWRIKAESLNEKLELNNDRYRKALDEIEEYCNNVLSFTAVRTTESDILNIINKAKGEENVK